MQHPEITYTSPVITAAGLEQKFIIPCNQIWEETNPLLEQAAASLTELQHSLYKKLLADLSYFTTFRSVHFYNFLQQCGDEELMQLSEAKRLELDNYLQDVKVQHQRLRDYFYRCSQVAKPLYESESPSYMLLRSRLLDLKKLTDEWIFREEAQLLPLLFSLK